MVLDNMIVFAVIAALAFVVAMYAILKVFCLEDDIAMLKDDMQNIRKSADTYCVRYEDAKARLNQQSTFNTALHYDEQK